MNTRTLGKTGYTVSEIGLGCWQLGGDFGPVGDETATEILKTARSLDVNFWDTADVYGGGESERRIGRFTDKKGVLIATKLGRGEQFPGMKGYTRKNIKDSLAGSIKRLGVDQLDLAQLHCIPIDVLRDGEVFTFLEDLKSEGMIRHWGASIQTIEEAMLCLRHDGLASLQTIFNLFRQDAVDTLFPAAQKANVGIIVRLPLASGLLSGKFTKDTIFTPQDHRTYNRDGDAFYVGETFSGPAVRKGRRLCRPAQADDPQGHDAGAPGAALDPRSAGRLDRHRRCHPPGAAQGQCRGEPHGPAAREPHRGAQELLPRQGPPGSPRRDLEAARKRCFHSV